MAVNWGLAEPSGGYDYLNSLQAMGQDALRRQQLQQSQYAFDQQKRQDQARPAIITAARNGDYRTAQDSAFSNNDMDALKFIGGLQEEQRAQVARHADAIAGVAANLSRLPQEQRQAALMAAAPQLLQQGFTTQELQQADLSDAGLTGYISAASNTKDALETYYKSQQPTVLADGSQLLGPQPMGGGARPVVAENAKDAPKPDYIWDPQGNRWLLKPGTGGAGYPGAGVPSYGGGPLSVDTLRPLFVAQESSGDYTAKNAQTGALGRYQVMPGTGQTLAQRAGLPWRPELMTSDSPQARQYQDAIGNAAIQDAIDASGGDPAKAFGYYYSGTTDQSKWGPKTRQYIQDMTARLGGSNPRQPQSQGAAPSVISMGAPRNTDYRILTAQEAQQRGLDPNSKWQVGPNNQVTALPAKGDKPLTEAQSKAVGYLNRAVAAQNSLNTINGYNPTVLAQNLDKLGTANPFREGLSQTDRRALSAMRAFTLAVLRQDSGAAINKDEFDQMVQTLFPMPGDGPEVQADKRAQREAALRGLRTSSGPGSDSVSRVVPNPTDRNRPGGSQDRMSQFRVIR